MIYALLLLFVAGLTLGAGGMNSWTQSALERKEAKRVAAEQKLAEEMAKGIKEAENKLIDMTAAFEAGQQQARVVYKTIYAKAKDYVQNTPAYSNPVCRVDAAGVQLVNDQIARMHAAAAARVLGIRVPDAGTDQGKQPVDGGSVSALSGQPATAEGVRGEVREPENASGVPGQGVQRPPKPKPVN